MPTREKLAESAYNSMYFSVIHHPSAWVDEIAESVADPAEFIRDVIRAHVKGPAPRGPVANAIEAFATKAAEAARDGVLNHPGPIV